ncbi:MAG: ATP-binding protein, partial [Flavobacterium sp.]
MKLSTIFFEEGTERMKGLKQIDLRQKPLGSIVALAGKNGSGKSRVLELIEKFAVNLSVRDLLSVDIINVPQMNTNLLQSAATLKKQFQNATEERKKNITASITPEFINICKQSIVPYIKKIDFNTLTKISKLEISSFEKLSQININSTPQLNFLLTDKTIEYLQRLSDELNLDRYNLIISENESDELNTKQSYINFEKFKQYVERFLGKKLSTKAKKIKPGEVFSSVLLINNHPFIPESFSPGEKILFSYAILFYLLDINSSIKLEDCIFILDEPETHLHPSAQIKVISAIKSIIKKKGQLWIATHSLPLLANLEYDEIFLVKDDCLIPPNRYNPGNSILELMESEENSFQLKEFLTSSSEWAYCNFMAQCFIEPEAHLFAAQNDQQINSFD